MTICRDAYDVGEFRPELCEDADDGGRVLHPKTVLISRTRNCCKCDVWISAAGPLAVLVPLLGSARPWRGARRRLGRLAAAF